MFEILAKYNFDALAEILGYRATSPTGGDSGPGTLLAEEIRRRSPVKFHTKLVLVALFADPMHFHTVVWFWHRMLLVDLPQRCGTPMVH